MKIGRRTALALLAAICACGAVAGQAGATALGPWNEVASSGVQNISEVGLARTSDGTLHIGWASQQPGNTENLYSLPISAAGSPGSQQTIVSGWASLEDPALGLTPSGGLQAFFGGIRTLSTTDPNQDENLATSTDQGNTWSLTLGDVVAPAASAYASGVAVSNSFSAQPVPFETWTGTSGVWVHAGTDTNAPNWNFQTAVGDCCGYYANLATDGSGNTVVAWYSNATGREGIWAQGVAANGSPIGSPQQMPDTANMDVGELQRTPLVARPQGGIYVLYPTGYPSFNAVRLWKVGGGVIKLSGPGSAAPRQASVAVDQAGRVWAFWSSDIADKPRLFAVRSDPSVTRFGAVVSVAAPANTESTYSVDGNAAAGALDLFTTVTLNTGSQNNSIWTRHVLPGLSLALSPALAKLHRNAKVTASVSDAGVPVQGATVKLGGHSAKTNASGKASFHIKVRGAVAAVASRAGYVNATAELHATR